MTRTNIATFGADIELFVADRGECPEVSKAALERLHVAFAENGIIKHKVSDYVKELPTLSAPDTMVELLHLKWFNSEFGDPNDYIAGTVVPCVGRFPGTKEVPWPMPSAPEGFALQEDNVMLEYNIPVCTTPHEFTRAIATARKHVKALCKKENLVPMWKLPEHIFKKQDLQSPQARKFGCLPDNDAYNGGAQRETPPSFGDLRTAGAHVHIGHNANCPNFVFVLFYELALANRLGCTSIINTKSMRHKWYGKPGIYRDKPYGVEYRTLSNAWTNNNRIRSEVAHCADRISKTLTFTPTATIQRWFRSIDWTVFRELLLSSPETNTEWHQKWSTISEQWGRIHANLL